MNRSEFLKLCTVLGIGFPMHTAFSSYAHKPPKFTGSVLIIGAGAAGMTTGYLLDQLGISYRILEAKSTYGGRIKHTRDFADFPIPLGGEWIHESGKILNEIVNDDSISVDIKTVEYPRDTRYGWWSNGELEITKLGSYKDLKFVGSSWLDFFEAYVLPSISEKITYNAVIESIDYSNDNVVATDNSGNEYRADKIIVTVPVKQLQLKAISFTPELPADRLEAIDSVTVWEGLKVFIEFKERFYPTMVDFDIKPRRAGQKLYYDASFGQKSNKHILGLFTVGSATREILAIEESERIGFILKELDTIFDNQATPNYVKHIIQNWVDEPYINGAYVNDHESWRTVAKLGGSVDDKVYFAGDAYTDGEDWGSVHVAARSAAATVNELAKS